MADVKIVDIDTEQWFIKDQNARDRISVLESRLDGYKTIRHDIEARPSQETNNIWSCLMNQIQATDWSFVTTGIYAYGQFIIITIGWGVYKAIRFTDNTLILSGILEYGVETHTFEAVFNPQNSAWSFSIDNEGILSLQDNILITYNKNRTNNGQSVSTEVFVRNVAQTTIGSLYTNLERLGLLNRFSMGGISWDLQRQHDGADLPKGRLGDPAYASTKEFDFSGQYYFVNVNMGLKDTQKNLWLLNWNNGNIYCEANMFGEPDAGIVRVIAMKFVV